MPGVTIGEGSIIGANSLVTDDIPPFTIAFGSPAKVIRELTEEEKKMVKKEY
jgi:acetyltransferase-like isoleucine patch superfamily enzyme